jgi:uncharacterized repeat protein (TIGR03943 family)
MKPELRRMLFSIAVLVWSAVLLYFHASGRINKYLAPDFRPIAFVGGLGLAVLGLFNLLTARQSVGCGHDHDHGDGEACHDHEASDIHPLAAFLLMVGPVLLSVAWTKDEYSASALARKGLYDAPSAAATSFLANNLEPLTREYLEKSHRRSADGYYEFNLMEIFFATGDREMQGLIDGMKVETEGRWIDDQRSGNPSRKRLYRLFITCCAADSRAIPIGLEYKGTPPDLPQNGWVKVAGTMKFPLEDGIMQPVLVVDRCAAAEPPFEESFLRN